MRPRSPCVRVAREVGVAVRMGGGKSPDSTAAPTWLKQTVKQDFSTHRQTHPADVETLEEDPHDPVPSVVRCGPRRGPSSVDLASADTASPRSRPHSTVVSTLGRRRRPAGGREGPGVWGGSVSRAGGDRQGPDS